MVQFGSPDQYRVTPRRIQHGVVSQPAVGGLDGTDPALLCRRLDDLDAIKEALLPVPPPVVGAMGKPSVRGRVLIFAIPPGQQAAAQGIVGVKAHAEVVQAIVQLRFRAPGQRIIDTLEHRGLHPAVPVADVPGVGNHPRREVGKAQLAELSPIMKVCHRPQHPLHRRRGIGEMQEYGIHRFQSQSLQALRKLFISRVRIQPSADSRVHLRGDFERSVQSRQRLAQ